MTVAKICSIAYDANGAVLRFLFETLARLQSSSGGDPRRSESSSSSSFVHESRRCHRRHCHRHRPIVAGARALVTLRWPIRRLSRGARARFWRRPEMRETKRVTSVRLLRRMPTRRARAR